MIDKIVELLKEISSKIDTADLSWILPLFSGFAIAIFAEPLRQFLFKPKLNLEFGQSPDCLSRTIEAANGRKVSDAYYIRVKVTNDSKVIARDCEAYLINIEKQNEEGKFFPTIYCDSIQLAWSCQGTRDRWRGINISKGVNQYLDVVTTRSISNAFEPQIMTKPFRYLELFKECGIFRFTIQVAAAKANPAYIKLIFKWDGTWDKLNAFVEGGDRIVQ